MHFYFTPSHLTTLKSSNLQILQPKPRTQPPHTINSLTILRLNTEMAAFFHTALAVRLMVRVGAPDLLGEGTGTVRGRGDA